MNSRWLVISAMFVALQTHSQVVETARDAALNQPMQFTIDRPCDGNGAHCGDYILAQGTFVAGTPEAFVAVLGPFGRLPVSIYFDSPGGDLGAALEVGRMIRARTLPTVVGGPYEKFEESDDPFAEPKVVVQSAICYSACAYAFLGGTTRKLQGNGRIGVHQFAGSQRDLGEGAAQVGVAVLSDYLGEMGVDRQMLDVASTVSADQMMIIPNEVAYALNVDNSRPPVGRWDIEADSDGTLFALVRQRHAGRDATTQIVLTSAGDGTAVGMITSAYKQAFRTPSELLSMLNSVVSVPMLIGGSRRIVLTPTSRWEQIDKDTYQRAFEVPLARLFEISAEGQIRLEAGFPNAADDIDPSTVFGATGMRAAIVAISRN